jgi:hypothetical protein
MFARKAGCVEISRSLQSVSVMFAVMRTVLVRVSVASLVRRNLMANDSTSDQVHEYQQARQQWENSLRLEGAIVERNRIIQLLLELRVIRRDSVLPKYVAFDTNGEKVLYLTGLEGETE